jgi:hypothetical protein
LFVIKALFSLEKKPRRGEEYGTLNTGVQELQEFRRGIQKSGVPATDTDTDY